MKIKPTKTRFNPGDEIHVVFWDDDIGAYNVEYWTCDSIRITITESGQKVEYCQNGWEDSGTPEDENLFETSYAAAKEAHKRNNKEKEKTEEEYDDDWYASYGKLKNMMNEGFISRACDDVYKHYIDKPATAEEIKKAIGITEEDEEFVRKVVESQKKKKKKRAHDEVIEYIQKTDSDKLYKEVFKKKPCPFEFPDDDCDASCKNCKYTRKKKGKK